MLQALLADRFKLAVHYETKDVAVYTLTVSKDGPKFHETTPDELPKDFGEGMARVTRSRPGQFTAQSFTMARLAQILSFATRRIVQDQTGLKGRYDIKLDWAPDDMNPSPGNADRHGALPSVVPAASSGPSIFTAVQEQLGLKLESRKGSMQILVIDHVEEPAPN
jgi:uncharacterized protein (TIGR03435 family)